jgi:hypothetical protein
MVAIKELQQQGNFDPAMFRRELVLLSMFSCKYVLPLEGKSCFLYLNNFHSFF